MGGKWLQTLKQLAPDVDHAAALLHPQTPAHLAFWHEAEAAAPKLGIKLVAEGVHDAGEVERAITAVAAQPNGGLNVYPHTVTEDHLRLIVELAGKYRLPVVYPFRYHAEAGGLLSYGVDTLDPVPRAAFVGLSNGVRVSGVSVLEVHIVSGRSSTLVSDQARCIQAAV